jgi:hypothetical protein
VDWSQVAGSRLAPPLKVEIATVRPFFDTKRFELYHSQEPTLRRSGTASLSSSSSSNATMTGSEDIAATLMAPDAVNMLEGFTIHGNLK